MRVGKSFSVLEQASQLGGKSRVASGWLLLGLQKDCPGNQDQGTWQPKQRLCK